LNQKKPQAFDVFLHRYSRKIVIAIAQWQNKSNMQEYIFTRGINLEVTLSVGSICAEQSAIINFHSNYCYLIGTYNLLCVSVLELCIEKDLVCINPKLPCGKCVMWLETMAAKKAFRIITYNNTEMETYIRYTTSFKYLKSKPKIKKKERKVNNTSTNETCKLKAGRFLPLHKSDNVHNSSRKETAQANLPAYFVGDEVTADELSGRELSSEMKLPDFKPEKQRSNRTVAIICMSCAFIGMLYLGIMLQENFRNIDVGKRRSFSQL